jgi:glyoxylase-like metal-dependent hydrolase (beta-lactamase superfamily II)
MLIDSGGSDEVGRHIASAVRRITAKPVTHVVNTHHHGDHYLGNAAFPGAKIISSEKCREQVAETGAEWLGMMEQDIGHKLPGTKVLAADVTYRERSTPTTINGVRVVFLVPKGSHTAGDLLVHLPDDGVLVAGDVLVNGIVPTLQDGYLRNWIGTLDEIRELRAEHFIPGHGDPMGAARRRRATRCAGAIPCRREGGLSPRPHRGRDAQVARPRGMGEAGALLRDRPQHRPGLPRSGAREIFDEN